MSPREIEFVQYDAFTRTRLSGNQCAVLFCNGDGGVPSDATMLRVTREFNHSETAFVIAPSRGGDIAARYWTPGGEIPLAGHPTLCTVAACVERGLVQEGPLRLELPAGVVDVEAVRDDAGVVSITMEQLDGEFGTILDDRALVADVIGLQEDDLLPDVPVQCVTTGAWHIMCAVRDRALLDKCVFDQGKVRLLRAKYPDVEFFCLHVFHVGTADDGSVSTMARGFAELPDPLEDPFTGSATGCMGVFCRKYNLLGSATSFTAEQGVQMGRPGMASVAFSATTQRVRVTGPAVPVVKGTIFVDDA